MNEPIESLPTPIPGTEGGQASGAGASGEDPLFLHHDRSIAEKHGITAWSELLDQTGLPPSDELIDKFGGSSEYFTQYGIPLWKELATHPTGTEVSPEAAAHYLIEAGRMFNQATELARAALAGDPSGLPREQMFEHLLEDQKQRLRDLIAGLREQTTANEGLDAAEDRGIQIAGSGIIGQSAYETSREPGPINLEGWQGAFGDVSQDGPVEQAGADAAPKKDGNVLTRAFDMIAGATGARQVGTTARDLGEVTGGPGITGGREAAGGEVQPEVQADDQVVATEPLETGAQPKLVTPDRQHPHYQQSVDKQLGLSEPQPPADLEA